MGNNPGNGQAGISFSVSKDEQGKAYVTTQVQAGVVIAVFSVPASNGDEFLRMFGEMLAQAKREESGLTVVHQPTEILGADGKPIRVGG